MKRKIFTAMICILLLGLLLILLNTINVADKIDASDLSAEIIQAKGSVQLCGGEYVQGENGALNYSLTFRWTGTGYLFFPRAGSVLINGEEPETMSTYRGILCEIVGNEETDTFVITVLPQNSDVMAVETYIYFGTYDAIAHFDILSSACNYFLEGFCAAVVVFSITLLLYKPTEKYLYFFALTAFITGKYSRLEILFSLLGLSILNNINIYFVLNQLILAYLQLAVMKEFMNVRIGRLHGSVLISLAAVPAILYYRSTSIFVTADILFYFVLYAVYFICFTSVDDGLRFEKSILLLAWVATSAMRFLDLFCEAGLLPSGRLNLLFRLRGIVSIVYIIAFFAIVCKRFADKFNAADQLNAKLEKKVEERSRENMVFVRSMLHNMKTPVFSLNGYSNMALDMLTSNPEQAKVYLSKINEKTLYLGQLMDQISLVTRMDAGVLKMKKISVSIQNILKHCIDNARVTADSKHICIVTECEEAAFVIADPIYLTQAIQNVLDNAVIHTEEHGEIVLSSEKSPDTESWLIRIRDNGCGIKAEDQGKIFDAYFSNRHGSSPSTGLGLYITSQLLKLNNGGISVSSEEGAGAEFTIFLPAAHVENSL